MTAPLLGPADLQAIRQIVADHMTALTVRAFGPAAIGAQAAEVQRLVNAGILAPDAVAEVDPLKDAYLLGLLRRRIEQGGGSADDLTLAGLKAMVARDPVPITAVEQGAIDYVKQWGAQACVGLGNTIANQVISAANVEDAALRAARVALIQDEAAGAIGRREASGRLASTLANATQDWGRDWLRIATTEMQGAHEAGVAQAVENEHGPQARVAKIPNPDACDHCKRLHLDADGRPRIFALSELEANGTNKGRKAVDWLPVVGTVHPWCLPAGEPVLTARGPIPVESVVVGDAVWTARNRWRAVRQTFQHVHHGMMVEVETTDGRKVRSTPSHPWLIGNEWKRADAIREGDEIGLAAVPLDTDHGPSMGLQVRRLATVLFGLDGRGVPIAAIDLDGHLALPVAQVDQVAADDGVDLQGQPLPGQIESGLLFQFGLRLAANDQQAGHHLRVGFPLPTPSSVGGGGDVLAVLGGRALVADLLRFADAARLNPGLLKALDDNPTGHPELRGYRQYGAVVAEVTGDQQIHVKRDSVHGSIVAADNVIVKSVSIVSWNGSVYNLGVDEDESYTVHGIATHNCHCTLVHVPDGFTFDDGYVMVPMGSQQGA